MRITTLFVAAIFLVSTGAAAQQPDRDDDDEPQPEPPPEPPPPPPPPPPINVTVQAPPMLQPEKPPEDTTKDHDKMVGHFGFSWFGLTNVPIATGTPGGTADDPTVNPGEPDFVPAPAIGIRYWMNKTVGLDAGIGFSVASGEVETTTASEDRSTIVAFLIHLGLPVSLVAGKHISLQLIPEFNIGHARSTVEPAVQADPPPNASLIGWRVEGGARIGGEIHFGFIGVPELALEGSIGAYLTYQRTKISVEEVHASQGSLLFTTAEYNSPWDFFTQHLRARYYF